MRAFVRPSPEHDGSLTDMKDFVGTVPDDSCARTPSMAAAAAGLTHDS